MLDVTAAFNRLEMAEGEEWKRRHPGKIGRYELLNILVMPIYEKPFTHCL
jgi:hypothetical protein